jgi:chorismate-pyruvate lyase
VSDGDRGHVDDRVGAGGGAGRPVSPGTVASGLIERSFAAQARRPDELTDVDVAGLTAYQRGLLVHDGTVTRFVEAAALEPVVVERVEQRTVPVGDRASAWLELADGASVVRRRIAIRGRASGRVYAFAESELAVSRLPAGFADELARNPRGLGDAIAESRLETRRELLWFGRVGALAWAPVAAALLTRSYRVFLDGRPAILVTESFPPEEAAPSPSQ